jgi:predicted Zn-dependent peptidase
VGGEKTERRPLMEAQVALGFEGRPFGHEDYFTAQLFASVLGGGMSSRLFQEVRENRGLCYSVYAFHWAFSDTGLFAIHAATGAEDLGELMPVIGQELLRVVDGVGADELDRARNQMKAGLLMALESPATRAGQIARQILLYGRPLTTEELTERIHAVTPADISRLAGEIVTRSTPTLAAVGPLETLISADEIAESLRSGSMALHG